MTTRDSSSATKKLWSYVVRYKLQIGIIVVFLLIIRSVYGMFSPALPVITLKDNYDFSGNAVSVTGQVKADCRCAVTATLNGQVLTLQNDGTFSMNLPVAMSENTGEIAVKATAKSSFDAKDTTRTSTYNRQPTAIDVVNAPTEWNAAKLTVALRGLPNAVVVVKESPTLKITLDGNGDGSAVLPFSTTTNGQMNSYTFSAKVDGYAEGSKQISVKNRKEYPVVYDVPSLLGKDFDRIRPTLGRFLEDSSFSSHGSEWFGKQNVEVGVSYDYGTNKITEVFLSMNDDNMPITDIDKLMANGNLKRDDTQYIVDVRKSMNTEGYTGIRVAPR